MKRFLLYILVVGAALLIPEKGTDVGKLQPVELVVLYIDEGAIVLETDTGDIGTGKSVEAAYEDLENTTPGDIFLDTAQYLLVDRDARTLIPMMSWYMKPGTKICEAETGTDLALAAEYLAAHPPVTELKTLRKTDKLSVLKQKKHGKKMVLKISN